MKALPNALPLPSRGPRLLAAVGLWSLGFAACDKPSPSAPPAAPSAAAASAPVASAVTPPPSSASAPPAASANDAPGTLRLDAVGAGDTVITPLGPIAVTRDGMAGKVSLAGALLLPPKCAASDGAGCKLLAADSDTTSFNVTHVLRGAGNREVTLVVQQVPAGNACNGGSFVFVRLDASKKATYSSPIDYCGGPDPSIALAGGKVRWSVPAHAPNRGTGKIAAEAWEYDPGTGALARAK